MEFTLAKKIKEAKDTYSFVWRSEQPIDWLPGQYFYFTLDNLIKKDKRGPTRQFSISTSPTENKIVFTSRIRNNSGFKQTLFKSKPGDIIQAEGPNGTFIIDEKEKGPHVLIAGGIGITPFRSQIKYIVDKKLKTQIHLIYSNSTQEEITFKEELDKWSQTNTNIKVDYTITKPQKDSDWGGLKRRIDKNMLKKLIKNSVKSKTYWVCGPPSMVTAMEKLLTDLKIENAKIRSEKFTGY